MSQARTNRRRRKQAANNYNHLAPRKRPNYRRSHYTNVQEAIAAERRAAASEARRSVKKQK